MSVQEWTDIGKAGVDAQLRGVEPDVSAEPDISAEAIGLPGRARDSRLPHLASTALVGALLLAAGAAALVLSRDAAPLVALALILAVPAAIQVGGAAVDLWTALFGTRRPPLPALSAAEAAPALAATAVVYPVIVYGHDDVDELLASMSAARAAAGDGLAMHLALVDFGDSATEVDAADAPLRAAIERGLAAINVGGDPGVDDCAGGDRVVGANSGAQVAALFRRRRWNPREGVYMGWERKRGKLEELTDLIAGQPGTDFTLDTPAARRLAARLRRLRYVLTIDVGNRPQPDSMWRMVATIAHPDNAPVVDEATRRVRSGFAFVRATDVPAEPGTLFEWTLRPHPVPEGELPLAQAFHGRDLYYGQGVIDVAAYRAVLAGRLPADRVLSHDKLECAYGRAAVIADARIGEAAVGDYLQFRRREHRWARGDTQALPWAWSDLPLVDRAYLVKDVLTHLSLPCAVALLALGWLAAPASQVGVWTLAVLASLAYQALFMPIFPLVGGARVYITLRRQRKSGEWGASGGARRRGRGHSGPGRSGRGHSAPGHSAPGHNARSRRARRRPSLLAAIAGKTIGYAWRLFAVEMLRLAVCLTLLADRGLSVLDAVTRSAYRMLISHRHMLRWTSFAQASRIKPGLWTRVRAMWPASALALALAALAWALGGGRLFWAAPLLAGWAAAPLVAWRASRPTKRVRG